MRTKDHKHNCKVCGTVVLCRRSLTHDDKCAKCWDAVAGQLLFADAGPCATCGQRTKVMSPAGVYGFECVPCGRSAAACNCAVPPKCDLHTKTAMLPDFETDDDGKQTGNLLWVCPTCCWSLPRANRAPWTRP